MIRRREFIAGLGGTAAWLLAAGAQRAMPVIGFLTGNASNDNEMVVPPFRRGIGEQGYVEGHNVEILYRVPEISYDRLRLRALAADLVRRRPAVIFAFGTTASLAAKEATDAISVVFANALDPVQAGLVASLNRPGGNVTGVTTLIVELATKRLELLHEIAPKATSIGYLNNPSVSAVPSITALETAARAFGVRLVTATASTPSEIERAFAMLVGEGIGALIVGIFFFEQRDQVFALTARYALPAMYAFREMVVAGGLISYAGSIPEAVRLAGTYVGRILKGEKPADLPVQQATRIETVLNLKTAKALGLDIPATVYARADEVIE